MKPSSTILENTGPLNQPALLVIDHREALVFRSLAPGSSPLRIAPQHSDGQSPVLHQPQNYSHATSQFEDPVYFQAIASELSHSSSVVVFGCAKGTASEMNAFVDWLQRKRAPLAERIVTCLNVDTHHRTHAQLLAVARALIEKPVHPSPDVRDKFHVAGNK
jgi:hypothetical protein